MATPRLLSLSRLLTTPIATTTLRRLTTTATTTTTTTTQFSLLRTISCAAARNLQLSPNLRRRAFSTQQAQSSMNDNNANWSNRPPKETILLDGCDFEHWLVVVEKPPPEWTRDQIIDDYIKTLATIVGSEDEARMKIYSVSTKHYFAFGALISEELTYKLKEMEKVRWVLPDSYLDVRNKDYGGEPFIDGQAVPYDPKYHEEWVRNNQKAMERNSRNDRPRSNDSSRNFNRRQRTNEGPMGGAPNRPGPPNGPPMGGAPNRPGPPMNAGYQQNIPPTNAGYQQNMPPNAGYQQNMPPNNPRFQPNMPQNNAGYQPNMPPNNAGFQQNMPPNNAGYQQNMPPPSNPGYQQNMQPSNPGYQQNVPPSNAGYQQNVPHQQNMPPPNVGYQSNMAPPPPPPSNAGYQPNNGGGYQPSGGFQNQNVPGRDPQQ